MSPAAEHFFQPLIMAHDFISSRLLFFFNNDDFADAEFSVNEFDVFAIFLATIAFLSNKEPSEDLGPVIEDFHATVLDTLVQRILAAQPEEATAARNDVLMRMIKKIFEERFRHYFHIFNSPLKNVASAAEARKNEAKKRSLHGVNEHFGVSQARLPEPHFDNASADSERRNEERPSSAVVFQRAVKKGGADDLQHIYTRLADAFLEKALKEPGPQQTLSRFTAFITELFNEVVVLLEKTKSLARS
jgi:hypothetical protein